MYNRARASDCHQTIAACRSSDDARQRGRPDQMSGSLERTKFSASEQARTGPNGRTAVARTPTRTARIPGAKSSDTANGAVSLPMMGQRLDAHDCELRDAAD